MTQTNMTREEWLAEGEKRFGPDQMKWKFICPICKTVASAQDYKDAGAPDGAVAFSCIGRYRSEKSQVAFQEKVKPGHGCNYTTGGLINVSPILVTIEEGKAISAFEFAPSSAEGE